VTEHAPVSVPKVEMTVTYLEMRQPPTRNKARPRPENLVVSHIIEPPLDFYRYLHDVVGRDMWFERRQFTDAQLRETVYCSTVEVWVPFLDGAPAGLIEFDFASLPHVELVYFGITAEHIGKGIGGYLLDWSADYVWARGAGRFWLHTCNFDHANAIPAYRRAGFEVYDTVVSMIDDPRALGLI